MLSIQLAEKDKKHLKKFCDFLNLNYSYIKDTVGGFGTPCCKVTINSKEIIEDLKKYNLHQNKTLKEKPYENIAEELKPAYIRGIFDGDGEIKSNFKSLTFCGSYNTLIFILNYFTYFIEINNKIREEKDIENFYRLEITSQKNIYTALNIIYENANIYLDRKYQLYKKYIDLNCRD